ncbi:unnamed protein product [Cylindrotheca closterium]|uniref:HSF-type DNA-binding domain-containing protein n=1 Tax=Cylindrotheca closterium TaxID=2856 RepID=A0AAD2CLZ0_9STRA|nr:unnamed protein product [Cylindrotheca closterium]
MSNWLTLPQLRGEADNVPGPSPAAAQHAPATWEAIAEVAQEVQKQHHQQQEEQRMRQEQQQQQQQQIELRQGQLGGAVALDGPIDPGIEQKMPGSGGSADSTYVMRIHDMLEDADREGNTEVVSWQSHGRSFRIHKESEFVDKIMPRYFKARLDSFKRWLRAWGFVRQTEGVDRGAWYHRYFVRGVTTLCKNMTRIQMLQAMENWIPTGQAPDFYKASTSLQGWYENPVPKLGAASDMDGIASTSSAISKAAKDPKRLRGRVLEDIRQMLEETTAVENEREIVSWMPHGRAFKVHQSDAFVKLIMPRYFKTAKITYFSDALRLWGFCRLKNKGPDKGAYFHLHFVRGDATQTRHLSRKQMKEVMANWPGPKGEPDLYSIQPLGQIGVLATPAAGGAMGTQQALLQTTNVPPNAGAMVGRTPIDPIEFLNMPVEGTQNPMLLNQAANAMDPNAATYPTVAASVSERQPLAPAGKSVTSGDTTYVIRIHELLEDSEKMGFQDIVSWRVHGRAFRVHNEAEFEEKIMPRYFKAKMASFQRWLRAWGFVRMTEGKDRGSWYHRYFVRGATDLCRNMSRLDMFNSMKNWLPIDQVPDFYNSGTGQVFSEAPKKEAPATANPKNPKRLRGTVLEDLRNMLEDAEQENSTSVTWLPHGRAFFVTDKASFVTLVLPRYFKAKKFTYFSDILRIWGFVRLKKQDKGAYFHRLFVRGKPELTRNLSRKQMKESMAGWPPPSGEPDLYGSEAAGLTSGSTKGLAPSTGIVGIAEALPIPAYAPGIFAPNEREAGDKQKVDEMIEPMRVEI